MLHNAVEKENQLKYTYCILHIKYLEERSKNIDNMITNSNIYSRQVTQQF